MTEAQMQRKAFLNLWESRPDLRGRVFAINNNSVGGARGSMNKALGVVPGVADMCFLKPDGKTCWIEWKTEKEKQKPKQIEFEQLCISLGHEYHIVRSEAEFLNVILHNQII